MTLLRDGLKVGGAAYVAKQFFKYVTSPTWSQSWRAVLTLLSSHRDKKYEAESRASQELKQPQHQQSQQQNNQQAPVNGGLGQEYYRQPTSGQHNCGN